MFTSIPVARIIAPLATVFALGLSQQSFAGKVIPYTSTQTSLHEGTVVAEAGAPVQKATETSTAWLTVIGMFAAAILFAGLAVHIVTASVALGVFTTPVFLGLWILAAGLLYGSVTSAVRIASPRTTALVVPAE